MPDLSMMTAPSAAPSADESAAFAEASGGEAPAPRESEAKAAPEGDGKPAPKAASAAPKAPRKVKLLADDGVTEEEYDEDVIRKAVKGPVEMVRGAQERFRELAKREKEIEAAREKYERNPFEAAKERGEDPIALAQKILEDEIARSQMSPAERRNQDLERQFAEFKANAEKTQKDSEAAQAQEYYRAEIAKIDRELPAAMERAGLPRTPVSLRLVANIIADMHDSKMPENYDLAAQIAAEQDTEHFGSRLSALTYEQAVSRYPDLVKKIREGDLAKARTAPFTGKPAATPPRDANGKFQQPNSQQALMDAEWGPLGVKFKRPG